MPRPCKTASVPLSPTPRRKVRMGKGRKERKGEKRKEMGGGTGR